nr:hypothetical protein [uncultured Desulfobacter sp.]
MQSRIYLEPQHIDGDTLEVAACFESGCTPGKVHRLWWRLPVAWHDCVTTSADPFVIAFLFPIMEAGCDVRIEGCVSPSLLRNLETYMAVWQVWDPERYKIVSIHATEELEEPQPAVSGETIMPFSCGVDSSYTALRHHRQLIGRRNCRIGAAVVMNGFDIWLNQPNAAAMYEGLLNGARLMLDSLGIPCIPMSNNYHELPTIWGNGFGTQLVSCLRLLSARFDTALIPNSMPYSAPVTPWGSTPLTDPLLSSRHFTVLDDGAESSRVDKISLISSWPEALQNLRVCFANPNSHSNCCRCEKCIRSMLTFRITGVPLPPAFERDITDRQIRKVRIPLRQVNVAFWDELLQAADQYGLSREPWARAICSARRRYDRRRLADSLRKPFIPMRNQIRTIFRGSPLSRSELAAKALAHNSENPS